MREEGRPVLTVNAGNMLFSRETLKPEAIKPAELTAELIVTANAHMGYDALNIGAYDLSLGIDYLIDKSVKTKAPLISANLYNRHGERLFAPTKLVEVGTMKVGIIGLTDSKLKLDKIPAGHKVVVTDPINEAQGLVAPLKEAGADMIVVLTDMKGGSLRKLAKKCPSIDVIIASDKRNRISLPLVVGQTYITHLNRGGRYIGRLEIGLLADKGETASHSTRGQLVGQRIFTNQFVQLRLEIPDDPVVGPMVQEGKFLISDAYREKLADNDKDAEESGCGTEFVGSDSCRECHAERFAAWEKTKHAKAFQVLVSKNRQYDAECIMCHSLAFECDDGKIALGNVEKFNNVQCESCHGPADIHLATKGEQSFGPLPTRDACLKCHTPERSGEEGFEYQVAEICREAQ
jgi:hypothetical protein